MGHTETRRGRWININTYKHIKPTVECSQFPYSDTERTNAFYAHLGPTFLLFVSI